MLVHQIPGTGAEMKTIRLIAQGGFGRVEEVRLKNGARAARKVFAPAFPIATAAEREKWLRRFQREVRIQSSINSAGIIPIIGGDLDCDEPYYMMPLAERNFLDEIASIRAGKSGAHGPLADILNALDELHELGYVHRDLKPANVLLHDGVSVLYFL